MSRFNLVPIALSLFLASNTVFAQDHSPTELTLQPIHIAAFKNGVGIVTAKVTLPSTEGSFRVHPLPDSSQGSFWLRWDDGLTLENITATQAKTSSSVSASNIPELLEANIGNNVWVTFNNERLGEGKQHFKIINIPEQSRPQVHFPKKEQILPPPIPQRGEIVLLESLSNSLKSTMAVPIHQIETLTFEEGSAYELEKHTIENVIEFDASPLGNASVSSPTLYITYLANGISWLPSYIIDISGDEKALFSAKSVVMNDLIPLESVSTELIAGFPHIQFSGQPSAFSLTPIQQIIQRAEKRSVDRSLDRMNNTISYATMSTGMALPSMPAAPITGEQTEDLYFYKLSDVTLKKGERGYFPLFAAEIPYEHIYTWDIPSFIDRNNNYRQDLIEARQEVWHSIKLTNTHNQPWTTAPAMVMKDNRVLGQDTIRFTPSNSKTELKITKALDIQAEVNEVETKRQRGALQHQRRTYDLVEVRGTLAVSNYKDKAVTLSISKVINGEVINAAGNPSINKLAEGLRSVNSNSEMKWEAELKPGIDNQLTLEYTYQVYVQG